MKPWEAAKIRYIKLGRRGQWWADCKNDQKLRLGFDSGNKDIFDLAKEQKWDEIKKYWIEKQVGTRGSTQIKCVSFLRMMAQRFGLPLKTAACSMPTPMEVKLRLKNCLIIKIQPHSENSLRAGQTLIAMVVS